MARVRTVGGGESRSVGGDEPAGRARMAFSVVADGGGWYDAFHPELDAGAETVPRAASVCPAC